jgi:hypothetical protein
MLQYGKLSNKNEIYLLGGAVRFGHFQLFSGQFDGLNPGNQSVTVCVSCVCSKKLIKFFNRIWEVVKPHKSIWISIEEKEQSRVGV